MPGILVVDDNPFMLNILDLWLQPQFEVWLAGNGMEALELYRRHQDAIHLVLLDIWLPGMNGPEILTALQAINPGVRACFMSSHPGPFEPEDLQKRGALHFFHKPIVLEELTEWITSVLAEGPGAQGPEMAGRKGPPPGPSAESRRGPQ